MAFIGGRLLGSSLLTFTAVGTSFVTSAWKFLNCALLSNVVAVGAELVVGVGSCRLQ